MKLSPPPALEVITGSRAIIDRPEHIVRQTAVPLDFGATSPAERVALVRALFRALHAGPVGVGLAAPMTGVGLRVIVTTAGEAPLALANPRIVEAFGPTSEETEGNLCLPGVRAPVSRRERVTVAWEDVLSGEKRTATFSGWHARVLQHEIEILDGRMFTDHASAPPLGRVQSAEEKARRAAARVFGSGEPERDGHEPLGIAFLPPALHGLDGVLTRPAAPVDRAELSRPLLLGMFRVLYGLRGVGLAAPQVGLGLRAIVIDPGDGSALALINPEIVDRDEREDTDFEGCLSIPGFRGRVRRSAAVKVRTDTVEGETVELDFSGSLARIAQHEIDHLDGILYTQRMEPGDTLTVKDPDAIADSIMRGLEPARPRAKKRRR
jgi:peptide deformylase